MANTKRETSIPLMGKRVSCGLFGIGDDFVEEYQCLNSRFIKNKESTFFFEATGNSMEPTIYPGEVLIVDRSITKFNGKVCIIALDGDLICKRVYFEDDYLFLKSDNMLCSNLKIYDSKRVLVWGVVTAKAADIE